MLLQSMNQACCNSIHLASSVCVCRGRQLDSLADAVAQRIGDFATALVTAADAELTSLRATAACDAAAVEESDSSDVSSNGSCAGTHSAQHRRAATEAEAGATEAGTHAAAKAAAAVEAALDGGAAMHAESVPVSPFGRFAAGRASGLSPSSLGAALAEDSDASRRGSADDAGMLLFGDDNFAGLRRRNLSAALTASPRSRDRTPRPSASLPVSPLQPTAPEAPEPGSSNYASADGSGRRNSRSSGDSRLGLPAAVPAHSGSSPPQPLLHAVRKPSDLGGQGAGSGDLNSSRRLSLQTFLQSQLELLNSQQPANSAPGAARASPWQQSPQPPAQQPAAQHAAGDSAAAPERRQPSAASSLPVTAGAAAAEAAAAALESAASALRQGAAATAAAADALPPAGTVLQAGAAAGAAVGAVAALAATAPVVAPAATEAVTSAIGDAAAAVVNSAAQTASAAVGAAAGMASTACGEVAAAAAGTAAEGAAAATCAAAQTAADVAAAGPIAQTAADAACCAAETAAHAAVPAASALGVAMVGAAGPAAAGLAGLVLRQQSFGEAGDGAQAASGASDQAQPAAQRSAGQSANSSSSSLQQLAERDSLPLAGLRGGALSSSNGQELSTATDVSPGCDSDAACHSSQHATKLGRHTPFGGKAGDETACCGAAGTCCCKCWQALSSPWLAIRGSALERHFCGWQPSRRLQVHISPAGVDMSFIASLRARSRFLMYLVSRLALCGMSVPVGTQPQIS